MENKKVSQDVEKNNSVNVNSNTKVGKKKIDKKMMIIIISIAAFVVLAGGIIATYLIFFSSKTIDLSECLDITYEGYNGNATATVEINQNKLKRKVGSSSLAKKIIEKIELEVSDNTNLSNGDEISIKASISDTFLENNKLKLKEKKFKVSVEGLEDTSVINLADYIDVTYTGYNKCATAEVELNSSLADKIGEDRYNDLVKQISFTIKDNENLENNKELEIEAQISSSWLQKNGIELESTTIKIEINGLEQGNEVDAFADITISLSGMSPDISITITNESTDEFIKTIKYTPSKSSGISNGETIKIEATSWDEDMAEENGYVLKETTMEYTVENQAAYLFDVSEITSEVKEQVKTTFIEKAKSKASEASGLNYYGNSISNGGKKIRDDTDYKYVSIEDIDRDLSLTNSELVSLYLLTKKEDSNSDEINQLVGIVRLTYTSATSGASYVWYATIMAKNFSIKTDGTISDNAVYEVTLDNGKDEQAAYEEWVNSKKENYDVESVSVN